MANQFIGRGNIGSDPTLTQRTVRGGETRALLDLRIYFDRRVRIGDDKFEDRGGFWLPVSLWGPVAETSAKFLRKGCRVVVDGTLFMDSWSDRDTGEVRTRIQLDADHIALDLSRVEEIRFSPKASRPQDDAEPLDADEDLRHGD